MASPTRKLKGRLRKGRGTEPCCSHRRRQTIVRRPIRKPVNVRQILYRMLNVDKHNQERKKRSRISSRDGRFHLKHRRESSYDSSPFRDSSPSVQGSEYTKSAATSVECLPSFMKARDSSRASSSENSSVSNMSVEPIALAKTMDNTRALLKRKSLVQVINNYIKAGIEEGKRRAKKYIRKALSFGVKSGYLIPADPRGQVIRVSPTLIDARKTDAESRRKRRRARRGEDGSVETKTEKRKTTPPWNAKKQPRREEVPKPETLPRKRRKLEDVKRSGSPKKKRVTKRKPRDKTEEKRTTKTKKRSDLLPSTSMNENVSANTSEESLRRTRLQQNTRGSTERRLRRARSPHPKRREAEDHRRIRTNSSDEEKTDQRFTNVGMNEATLSIGRRKSTTSRESLRNSNNVANPGNSMRQVEEKLEAPDENEESNTIGNMT
ncbi:serine/arginine repetitive matrix protein 1-like [Ceratina calcarata]|uniref:Serine/arginine repetitive matrix protein 1-like n=1 Tax=Ceratina calcarata TaxID=156304 RepID=A0AAJ7WFF8_9HYME|nr:serine/arginine repetitive matrix protein 1-like [Ceratina calcarata]